VPHQRFEPESGFDEEHVDTDRLVAAAFGEGTLGHPDAEHLRTCPGCQAERDALTNVADLVRSAPHVATLPVPPPRVWDRIAADTGVAPTVSAAPRRAGVPRWRMPWRPALLAAAAAGLGIVGTIGIGQLVSRTAEPVVTAQADLAAFGTTPAEAHGLARVLSEGGTSQLQLQVAGLPSSGGFYEVWLINPDTGQMISVGILGGQTDVLLPLANAIDTSEYRLVDVSAEPLDGDPAHSGNSLLRGTLVI
jgi:hypothetical protein